MSKDVFREMAKLKGDGQSGALATVVARKGSAPMSGDAKMLVREDGSTEGTVGGGCLEAEVWETAMSVLETGEPEKLRFDLTQQEAEDSGHICGGVVEILVEPFQAFQAELLDEINHIRNQGGSAALATIVQPGDLEVPAPEARKMLFRRDGSALGEIPNYSTEIWAESTQIIRNGSPTLLQFNTDAARAGGKRSTLEEATEIFVEPISGQPLVYIFGGGHVSFCVAQAAYLAGFRVSIVEDRPSFANKERFPMAESFFVGEFPDIFEEIPVDESDYLAIITRGPFERRGRPRMGDGDARALYRDDWLQKQGTAHLPPPSGQGLRQRRTHRACPCAHRSRHRRRHAGRDRGGHRRRAHPPPPPGRGAEQGYG